MITLQTRSVAHRQRQRLLEAHALDDALALGELAPQVGVPRVEPRCLLEVFERRLEVAQRKVGIAPPVVALLQMMQTGLTALECPSTTCAVV